MSPSLLSFTKKVIPGWVLQLTSRRTDLPFSGYLAGDGSVVQDYQKAEVYPSQAKANDAIATFTASLSGEVSSACAIVSTNKIVLIVRPQ